MHLNDSIYVAGHTGLVGSALLRELERQGYTNIITRSFEELDLRDQAATSDFFAAHRPAYVFLAAAKVGGIGANAAYPADFLTQNIAISFNVINAAYAQGTTKLLNFGSSCIYPRLAPQPIPENALLSGPLEPTNEAYALAKIAALKLCASYHQQHGANFFSVMPTNLYGINDSYDLETSHVLPALIARFHQAKITQATEVTLWGDGSPLREFLYADDLACAAVHLMQHCNAADIGSHINIGSGQEVSIAELAGLVRKAVYSASAPDATSPRRSTEPSRTPRSLGFSRGAWASPRPATSGALALPGIVWDKSKPNGIPRKLLDSRRIKALGWEASTALSDGITAAYTDYLARAL